MSSKFVDREEELGYLESLYRRNKAQLIVIYGRRRIGKTALVKRFMENKKGVYFYAMKQPLELELERLAETVSRVLGRYVKPNFESVFAALSEAGKIVVIIDEFTYWIEEDPRVLSILQRIWDEYLSKSSVFLILVASTVTLVEKSFSYGSGLYGRRTGQWKLGPLEPFYIRHFLPNYDFEDLVRVYGCVGSIPYYLSLFDPKQSFEENVNRLFFNKGGVLYEEAENLLRYEVRDPYIYLNIVRAIEEGATTYSKISDRAKVNITNLSKYLHVLEKLDIVVREKPIMGKARPIYVIKDNYIRFWVRYVYPNKDKIEWGTFWFRKEQMNNYLPKVFEDLVRHSLKHLYRIGKIPILGRCGRYWEKEKEIDIVCIEDDKLLAIEVKWRNLKTSEAEEIIQELRRKLNNREAIYGVAAKTIKGEFDGIKIELKDLFKERKMEK